jgi:amino acid adenylation domain-containing protein
MTAVDGPPTVLDLFTRQVRLRPDAVAVVAGTERLSYRLLDERSTRLARLLAARGAAPGRLVAVALEPGIDLVIALFAVLRSGAGYLPLAVDDPRSRREYLLADAEATLLIRRDADTAEEGPAFAGGVVAPDAVSDPAGPVDLPAIDPASTAYVIYTSGSTGRPKGVVVSHRALSAYLGHAQQAYSALTGTALLHSSVSFDLAVTTLYGPLISGGTIEIADLKALAVGDHPAPAARPDFLKITPSHLPLLELLPESARPTGTLVIGGELLTTRSLHRWRQRNPGVSVVNEYGPTEATVGCCAFVVDPGEQGGSGDPVVPIGTATPHARLHVLDPRLQPVPSGQTGELYVGGDQLADGYLHQPATTAARFVADPWGPTGSRLYRTGDQVRTRADGALVYLGRLDDQVKISGYRVEPGEVEAAVARCTGVRQCAVVVGEAHGLATLVGFVVPEAGADLDLARLRVELEQNLPAHLVPSVLHPVLELPLAPSGKVDRRKLSAPVEDPPPPRTALEEAVCRLMAQVLEEPAVGSDDDFIARGGSSIAAIRLVSSARRLGLRLDLRLVLRHRTARRIVAHHPSITVPEEMI